MCSDVSSPLTRIAQLSASRAHGGVHVMTHAPRGPTGGCEQQFTSPLHSCVVSALGGRGRPPADSGLRGGAGQKNAINPADPSEGKGAGRLTALIMAAGPDCRQSIPSNLRSGHAARGAASQAAAAESSRVESVRLNATVQRHGSALDRSHPTLWPHLIYLAIRIQMASAPRPARSGPPNGPL